MTVGNAFSESREERLKRRMQLREKMHQKMRESLFDDFDVNSSFSAMDKMMDELMKDAFSDFDQTSFQANSLSHVSTYWNESSSGRTLIVKTNDKDAKLDVQVKNQIITIKADYQKKAGQQDISALSSQVQPVPNDCDGDQVKMKATDKGLELFFPYKSAVKTNNGRVPIQPKPNDIQT